MLWSSQGHSDSVSVDTHISRCSVSAKNILYKVFSRGSNCEILTSAGNCLLIRTQISRLNDACISLRAICNSHPTTVNNIHLILPSALVRPPLAWLIHTMVSPAVCACWRADQTRLSDMSVWTAGSRTSRRHHRRHFLRHDRYGNYKPIFPIVIQILPIIIPNLYTNDLVDDYKFTD